MEMKIGDRIALLRKERGWSQEDLARKMGYTSRSTINKVELNKTDVTQTNVVKYAKVFGCSVAYLMGWEDESKYDKQMEDIIHKIENSFADLDDSEKELLIKSIEATLELIKLRK